MAMTPAEIDEYRALKQARDGLPFVDFVRAHSPELTARQRPGLVEATSSTPELLGVPRHLVALYNLIQLSRTRPVYATVSMPPRGGKSTTLRNAVAYRLLRDPACLSIYTTFSRSLANDFSYKTRKLARKAGVPLAKDRASVDDWATDFDGGLKATSVGGDVTGRGCNGGLIVGDDLIKGREAANSKNARDKAWDYLLDDVMSRIERGASCIIVGTRWHVDDPIGRILKDDLGETWVHIKIPAVVDKHGQAVDGGPRGEEFIDGEHFAFWPEAGYDLAWARKQRAKGAHRWWSLYQQEPRPRDGKLFGEPARFDLERWLAEGGIDGWRLTMAWDPAGTEHTKSDYQAAGVLAMRGTGTATEGRPIARLHDQIGIPAFLDGIKRLQARHRVPVWFEGQGGFAAVPGLVRAIAPELDIRIIPGHLMKGGKLERATELSVAWNDQGVPDDAGGWKRWPRFMVPRDPDGGVEDGWDDYLAEFDEFTGAGGAHDDQVDWTAHAWNIGARDDAAPNVTQSLPTTFPWSFGAGGD